MSKYRVINNKSFRIAGFNGSSESAIGLGDIGILKGVLHISNISNCLISTTKLSNSGYTIFQPTSESYIRDMMC